MKLSLAESFFYRINGEKSLSDICAKLNVTENQILRNNNNLPLYDGEVVIIKTVEGNVYRVKPLDTLDKLATQFGVDKLEIIKANNLVSEKLFIGQQIIISNKKAT